MRRTVHIYKIAIKIFSHQLTIEFIENWLSELKMGCIFILLAVFLFATIAFAHGQCIPETLILSIFLIFSE